MINAIYSAMLTKNQEKERKKKLFNYKYYEIPGNVYTINDPFAI